MDREIVEYKMIRTDIHHWFEWRINESLKEGWHIHWESRPPDEHDENYRQAMVKYKDI